jgi:hypothetical protein
MTLNVVADAPLWDQGDIKASPSPDPSANRISEVEAATKAPEMIAGHDTADVDTSIVRASAP